MFRLGLWRDPVSVSFSHRSVRWLRTFSTPKIWWVKGRGRRNPSRETLPSSTPPSRPPNPSLPSGEFCRLWPSVFLSNLYSGVTRFSFLLFSLLLFLITDLSLWLLDLCPSRSTWTSQDHGVVQVQTVSNLRKYRTPKSPRIPLPPREQRCVMYLPTHTKHLTVSIRMSF